MTQEATIEKRLQELKAKRPKAGSYETFTVSQRGESRMPYQKARYHAEDKRSARELMDSAIQITIQRGVEFDVYQECLGSRDGKVPANPHFHKLVTEGFLRNGQTVFLDPDDMQKFLSKARKSDTNRIILWKDRPRPEAEKALEKALESKNAEISSRDLTIETLRKTLKGRGMKDEEIEALISKGA